MPQEMVGAFISMIPALRAQESLRRYEETVYGSGAYAKKERHRVRRAIRDWQKDASRYARKAPKGNMKHMRMKLASIGIPIIIVPRKDKK